MRNLLRNERPGAKSARLYLRKFFDELRQCHATRESHPSCEQATRLTAKSRVVVSSESGSPGDDLRNLPLLERKRRLRRVVPRGKRSSHRLRYLDHIEADGCAPVPAGVREGS